MAREREELRRQQEQLRFEQEKRNHLKRGRDGEHRYIHPLMSIRLINEIYTFLLYDCLIHI